MNFEELLKFAVDQGASDVHLQAGSSPQLRLGGLVRNVEGPAIDGVTLRQFAASIAPQAIAEDLDGAMFRGARFSRTFENLGRFRCGLYSQRGNAGLVLRVVPAAIRTLEQLNLPPVLREIALVRRGLTIVTGPSGSGKTATLSALVDHLNESIYGKIVTIENPVETIYPHKKALVARREVGTDVASTAEGIEQAIAQDADVIVAGDLRDAASVRLALLAAETGHQVFATMFNPNSTQVLERLIGMVPSEEKRLVTSQLAEAVVGIIAQKLASTLVFEHTVRRRVRDHEGAGRLRVLDGLLLQVVDVDVAPLVARDHDDTHAGHRRRPRSCRAPTPESSTRRGQGAPMLSWYFRIRAAPVLALRARVGCSDTAS